jgi:hypothetical protein
MVYFTSEIVTLSLWLLKSYTKIDFYATGYQTKGMLD